MRVPVTCTHCGMSHKVQPELLGQTGKCSRCGQKFSLSSSKGDTGSHRAADTSATNQPAPPSGQATERIGRFEVRGLLGGGAFGLVYRAYDPQLDREVALKVPQAGMLDRPKVVERFLREAKAAAQLRHPNIVPVYDTGRDGDRYYIASAFINGQTLLAALEPGPLPVRDAAEIVRKLAEGLDHAHSLKIVHRDVKSANVLLDGRREPHLTDFGLARLDMSTEKLTVDGAVLGTPAYMAPEQASGQQDTVSGASDQYSLGVVLYELLTGRTPFQGPPAMVISKVLHQEPPAPRTLRSNIPRDLETICLKTLSKEATARYESCQDLADDLRRFLADEPIMARRMSPVERLARWCRREPITASLIGMVLLVFSMGLTTTLWQSRQTTQERDRALIAVENESVAKQKLGQSLIAESKALDEANRSLYSLRMREALLACLAHDSESARKNLSQCMPQSGARDFRGWEWWFLHTALKDGPQATIDEESKDFRWSSDGARLLVNTGKELRLYDPATGKLLQKRLLTIVGRAWDCNPRKNTLAALTDWGTLSLYNDYFADKVSRTVSIPDTPRNKSVNKLYFEIAQAAWSPDGSQIVVLRGDSEIDTGSGSMSLVDIAAGRVIWTRRWSDRCPLAAVWSPDGKSVCVSFTVRSGTVSPENASVIDAGNGKDTLSLKGIDNSAVSLTWSRDGSLIAGSPRGMYARFWDAKSGKQLGTLIAAGPGSRFSKTSDLLATKSKALSLWDLRGNWRRFAYAGTDYSERIEWNPRTTQIAVSTYANATHTVPDAIRIFETANLKTVPCRQYFRLLTNGSADTFFQVSWSDKGNRLAALSRNYNSIPGLVSVAVLDPASQTANQIELDDVSYSRIVWHSNGSQLIAMAHSGKLAFINSDSMQVAQKIDLKQLLRAAEWDPFRNILLIVNGVGELQEVIGGVARRREIPELKKETISTIFRPRGTVEIGLITGSGKVLRFGASGTRLIGQIAVNAEDFVSWEMTNDNKFLCGLDKKGFLACLQRDEHDQFHVQWKSAIPARAFSIHPNQSRILFNHLGRGVTEVQSLASGQPLLELKLDLVAQGEMNWNGLSVSWSPDGTTAAIGGYPVVMFWSGPNTPTSDVTTQSLDIK